MKSETHDLIRTPEASEEAFADEEAAWLRKVARRELRQYTQEKV